MFCRKVCAVMLFSCSLHEENRYPFRYLCEINRLVGVPEKYCRLPNSAEVAVNMVPGTAQ